VEKPGKIRVGVGVGALQGIAHAGLRREVDDDVGPSVAEYGCGRVTITQIDAVKLERGFLTQSRDAGFLQSDVVVRIQIIDPDDLVPIRQQSLGDVISNETGGSGDELWQALPRIGEPVERTAPP
jgi:hypothetical protein